VLDGAGLASEVGERHSEDRTTMGAKRPVSERELRQNVSMPLMKGSAFTARFNYLRSRFPDRWDGYVRILDAETRALAEGPCMKSSWYPFSCFVDLNLKADRLFGNGDLAICREMGREAAKANLPTLYRIFYRVGSPEFVLDKVASVWRQHHDTGHSTVVFPGPNRASYQVHEFAAPHPTLCRSLEGFLHGSLEVMGLRDTEVHHVHCRLDGAAVCEYEGTWKPR